MQDKQSNVDAKVDDSLRHHAAKNVADVVASNNENSKEARQLDKQALELLNDPNLLGRIQRILHKDMLSIPDKKIGIVGEATLSLYVFLTALSSRPVKYETRTIKGETMRIAIQRMPQMAIVVGTSRSGKTRTCNTITWLFEVKVVGANSAKFLLYTDLAKFDILYMQELFDKDNSSEGSQLRLMSDEDGGLTFGVVEAGANGGFVPVEKIINPIMVLMTTTKSKIEAQLANRSHILNTDESPAQTQAIVEADARKRKNSLLVKLGKVKTNNESHVLKRAIQLLDRDIEMQNSCPASLNLIWPSFQNTRIRSDAQKLQSLVLLSAFLHQHQRPYVNVVKGDVIERNVFAIPQDYYFVLELVRESIATMFTGLDERSRALLPFLHELSKLKQKDTKSKDDVFIEGFTSLQATALMRSKGIEVGLKTIERRLETLTDTGIIETFKPTFGHRNLYKVLLNDEELSVLNNIGGMFDVSDKFLEAAQNESREYFAMLKASLGDEFKMPSEDIFTIHKSPNWFTNGDFENYKVVDAVREPENLGNLTPAQFASFKNMRRSWLEFNENE